MDWACRNVLPTLVAAVLLIALAACGQSASSVSGQGAGDPDTLVFAAVPSEQTTTLEQNYQPVLDMLSKETGKKIEFHQATNYAAVIEGQLSGQVQIAQYGPLSFVLAQSRGAAINAIGVGISARDAPPGYQSYAVTKAGSPIRSLMDLAGKKVCFVDPTSTSGYLYPSAALLQDGIDPATGVQPVFTGSHDASVLEVAAGRCAAGFAQDSIVDTMLIRSGQLKPGEVTPIWKSDTIPGAPIAISNSLSLQLQAKLTEAVQKEANVDYLKANGYCSGDCKVGEGWGYAPADNGFYDTIREVCKVTKNKSCTQA
jgi:phosphonate transport system substrate-binding protein